MNELALNATVLVTVFFKNPHFPNSQGYIRNSTDDKTVVLGRLLSLYDTSCFMHKKIHH